MAWTLEIHHLDVGQGDSTLIVAREVAPFANPLAPVIRSVLIDAGLGQQAADINAYITGPAGLAALSVLVITHYDRDHFLGAIRLLGQYPGTYNATLIFDQGWPGAGGHDNDYTRYLQNINGLVPAFGGAVLPRVRVTNRVQSYGALGPIMFGGALPAAGTPSVPAGAPGTINQPADWLVGQEIMWTNAAGAYAAALHGGGAAPGAAGGPPALTCIAANEYVLQPGGNTVQIPSGLNPNSAQGKNGRSLCFLLQFEGFRYYIGGDITSLQEDDPFNAGASSIGSYLATHGQIHAMKASHHGSGDSSSLGFLTQLDPVVVVVSCGTDNGYGLNPAVGGGGPWPNGHPQQRLLADMELLVAPAAFDNYYMTRDRSSDDFCRRLNQGVGVWPQAYTARGVVAGGWGPPGAWAVAPAAPSPCGGFWPNDSANVPTAGHIRLDMTAGNAAAMPPTFTVTYTCPRISMPVLNTALRLPANVGWPAAVLPTGTVLPTGSLWPGVAAPVQGMTMTQAHILAVNLPWPNGQTLDAGVLLAGVGPAPVGGYVLPLPTLLPGNVIWAIGQALPIGTILPAAVIIPPGTIAPPALAPGTVLPAATPLPAGVVWPAGVALPAGTVLPAGPLPVGTTWPAATPLPAGVPPMGTTLPVGTTLPAGLVFPLGTLWPIGAALPELQLPAGVLWPVGVALPAHTEIPAGTTLPPNIHWPPGVAVVHVPFLPTVAQVNNH